jgi:hypothetical protein
MHVLPYLQGKFSMDTKQSPVKGACNKHLQNEVENLVSQDLCCLQNDRVHSFINKLDRYLLCSLYFPERMR